MLFKVTMLAADHEEFSVSRYIQDTMSLRNSKTVFTYGNFPHHCHLYTVL